MSVLEHRAVSVTKEHFNVARCVPLYSPKESEEKDGKVKGSHILQLRYEEYRIYSTYKIDLK